MNINIGENIKNLRKRKDITQEELAECLGISFQSISKWERGEGFPDITMLPDLADFFNTSVDELLGTNRLSGGDFYNAYKQAHEYESNDKFDEAIELLRDTLKKSSNQSNEYDIISKLSSLLLLVDNDSEEGKILAKKAITLCERKLDGSISDKYRSYSKAMLCFLYDNIGERQKAKDLARNLPHVWESRELLYAELLEGQEYVDYLKQSIRIVLSIIAQKIESIEYSAEGDDCSKKLNVIDMLVLGGRDDIINLENKNKVVKKIVDFLD